MRNGGGFSLIETLVALLIFEFGMLALTAASAVVARDLGDATRRSRAHTLAGNRVEQLRAQACSRNDQGSARTASGLTEFWRIQGSGPARVITDSVVVALSRGRRSSVVVRGWAICPM